ncbi:proton-conducting transporter membrane subunit [Lentzea sp. NBC_00516]|uniref:Proton-conducting transporter membrane subunit n=1 Tax=Lentzea sokolovensis TaxID=3095429 RepID=A0ABU4UPR0_9PSEU|nr:MULTISPECIES: proton-conducting transporter membrane subunit [unclassified Lentzea]MDX8141476.1 proton-conducting transporter membrane subunit [Lentzea sp. BCCO 10_0061]WUD27299.1 proton-conducting transporter membrane subunit [Lentzea sp. NBC_00516]
MTVLVPVGVPVLGALTYLLFGWRRATAWISALSASVVLTAAILLAVAVTRSGPLTALGGLLRVDALSAFMLLVIGSVGLIATAATPSYLREEITAERATGRTAARHSMLVQLFLATMALAVLAANLGVVWVAVEATTIVTAFLVGQRRTRASVEAAWKYVVICSAGIALALLGTIVLNFAAAHAPGTAGLDLTALATYAPGLDPGVTRIAIMLLVLGFGTKAGLAPLHAWLPDAHSQAPAPVSALMSGVLLSVAFYAILRVKVISDGALGTGFARTLLAVMALASLLLAASLLIAQRDYKRMLAYSSIEHLGLVAFGAAIGSPLALAAALLHVLGHGLVKSVLFLGAGRVLQITGTSQVDGVRGLLARHPALAVTFGLGVFALIGLPPFSLFASELGIVRAGFTAGLGLPTAAALLLVLVVAAALIVRTSRMLLGPPLFTPDTAAASPIPIALAGGLLACAVLGVAAGPLPVLLDLATDTLVVTR